MMRNLIYRDIFLLPLMAGMICQIIKLVIYSVVERKIMPGGLFKPDGMPNVHASVFAALSTVIAIKYGFSSLLFAVTATYSVVILHDTMRVKREKEKQVDILNRILASLEGSGEFDAGDIRTVLQYRPLDVLGGACLGVAVPYFLL